MSSHDLSVEYDSKEREYKTHLENLYLVEQEILHLRKQIIDLQAKKQELEISKSKASHIVRQCKVDMDLLKNAYFQAKHAGV